MKAILSNGNYVLVSQILNSSVDGMDIYAQIFDSNDVALSSQFRVNTFAINAQFASHVAPLSNGQFIVTWQSYGQDVGYTGSLISVDIGHGIYAQIYNSDGTTFGSEFLVNSYVDGDQSKPWAKMLNDGKFVITWSSNEQDGSNRGVYAQIYNSDGTAFGNEFQVNNHTDSSQTSPHIESLENGNFVIIWISQDQDGSSYGIYGQLYDISGSEIGSEFRINQTTNGAQTSADITLLGENLFLTAWTDESQNYAIIGRIFDNNGNAITNEIHLTDIGGVGGYLQEISLMPNGDVMITWREVGNGVVISFPTKTIQISDYINLVPTDIIIDNLNINENLDGAVIGNILVVDMDLNDTYTFTVDDNRFEVVNGQLKLKDGISLDYEMENSVTVNVTATDSGGLSYSEYFAIGVNDVNDDPFATSDAVTVNEDGSVNIDVLANDTDEDEVGDALSVLSVGNTSTEGGASINVDGTVKYDSSNAFDHLAVGETTTDTFEYTVSDGNGGTDTEIVTVTVEGANDAPKNIEISPISKIIDFADGAFLVNTYTSGDQYDPSTTVLSNGNLVVTWYGSGQQDDSSSGIYAQIFNADGTKLGAEFLVNTYTYNSQSSPSITTLNNGSFVVAWHGSGQQGTSSGSGVYAQIFNADGTKSGSEFSVNTYTSGGQYNTSIAALGNGNFVVTWEGYGQQDDSGYGIYAQLFNVDGTKVGSEFLVNTYIPSTQRNPSIATLNNDNFIITWDGYGGSQEDSYNIYGQIFNESGAKLGSEFLVSNYTSDGQYSPSTTELDNGNFVVAWYGYGQQDTSDYGIYVQVFDANGAKVGDEFLVNTYTSDFQYSPNILRLDNGMFFVSWHGEGSEDSYGTYGQYFNADGTKFEDQFLINDTTDGGQYNTELSKLDNGDIVVTWHGNGVGDDQGIFAKILKNPTLSVDENVSGAIIGDITVTDTDNNDTSHILTVDDTRFEIVVGQLKLKDGVSLNFETQPNVTVNVTATDSGGLFLTEEFVIKVRDDTNESEPPVAVLDAVTVSEDVSVNIDVLSNDTDADNDPLSVFAVNTLSTVGLVTINVDGTVNYSSNGQFEYLAVGETALDIFDYTVSDADGGTDTTTVIVTVEGLNDAPNSIEVTPLYLADGPEFLINTYTSSSQWDPSISVLNNGNFVVAWGGYGPQDDFSSGVYAQFFDPLGNKISNEFLVNTYKSGSQQTPQITALNNGNFVVSWESFVQDGSATGIYAQLFDSLGDKIGDEFLVNTYTDSHQRDQSITGLNNGGFVVTWEGDGLQDASGYGIFAQVFDANGAKVGNEFLVNTYTKDHQFNPSVATINNGNFVVTWDGDEESGSYEDIYAQIFDQNGSKVGVEFLVNSYTNSSQSEPLVAGLNNGNFVLTWQGYYGPQDSLSRGVYMQIFDASGNKIGSEVLVNTYITDDQFNSDILGLNNGMFMVSWYGKGAEDSYGTYGQFFNADGTKSGGQFLINDTTNETQSSPKLSQLDNGDILVTWDGNGIGDDKGIFAKILKSPGLSADENDVSAVIGDITVTDTDTNDTSHTLTVDDTRFEVVNGQLKLKDGVSLDYEAESYVTLNITATDISGLSYADYFTIEVVDMDDDDLIEGTQWDDTLNGGIGNDTIKGFEGDDIISGDEGNDILFGSTGNDTYLYEIGDGSDIISDGRFDYATYGTSDNITFGNGILPSDITLSRSVNQYGQYYDLVISFAFNSDTILVKDHFAYIQTQIEELRFNDGTVWDLVNDPQYIVRAEGTSGDDNMTTGEVDDEIYGNQGNDTITDTNGNDTYYYNLGDGSDYISDGSALDSMTPFIGFDKIIFGAGINPDYIVLNRFAGQYEGYSDLTIGFKNNNETIIISEHFSSPNKRIEEIHFDDGTVWDLINVPQFQLPIMGTAGDDTIRGGYLDDVIYGNEGDDIISDSNGNDTYYYNLGDGSDRITDYSDLNINNPFIGFDKIVFGDGINPNDISVKSIANQSGYFYDLEISFANSSDTIVVEYHYNDERNMMDELHFANGSVLNLVYFNDLLIGNNAAEFLEGGEGDDTIIAQAGNDIVRGGLDNDTLYGNLGNDLITGDEGNDVILGGYGNDYLFGGTGDDIISGGLGKDFLNSGTGSDKFVFSNIAESVQSSSDTINDFEDGVDLIDLSGLADEGVATFSDLTITNNLFNTVISDDNSLFEVRLSGNHILDQGDFVF